jgi:hypothetical protein
MGCNDQINTPIECPTGGRFVGGNRPDGSVTDRNYFIIGQGFIGHQILTNRIGPLLGKMFVELR